jgi:hypothetical protein
MAPGGATVELMKLLRSYLASGYCNQSRRPEPNSQTAAGTGTGEKFAQVNDCRSVAKPANRLPSAPGIVIIMANGSLT